MKYMNSWIFSIVLVGIATFLTFGMNNYHLSVETILKAGINTIVPYILSVTVVWAFFRSAMKFVTIWNIIIISDIVGLLFPAFLSMVW